MYTLTAEALEKSQILSGHPSPLAWVLCAGGVLLPEHSHYAWIMCVSFCYENIYTLYMWYTHVHR